MEWPTILALQPIITDRGAPWIRCIREDGETAVSFKLTQLKPSLNSVFQSYIIIISRALSFSLIAAVTTTLPTVCPQKTTSGKCCSIPFEYSGVTYNSCTSANHNRPWCSLDPVYKGRWGNCREFEIDLAKASLVCISKLHYHYTKSILCLLWQRYQSPQRHQLFALRRQHQANVAVFHSNTVEWPTILALLLIITDPGAPWIPCTREDGATAVSFKLT